MTANTTSELFDQAGTLSGSLISLIHDAWAVGVRDGLHTAAVALEDTIDEYADHWKPPVVQALRDVATIMRLSALGVPTRD